MVAENILTTFFLSLICIGKWKEQIFFKNLFEVGEWCTIVVVVVAVVVPPFLFDGRYLMLIYAVTLFLFLLFLHVYTTTTFSHCQARDMYV